MPRLGLGTWELKTDTADIIAQALAMGYQMIDTSGDYGTQPGIGKGLKESGATRDSVYIVTKIEETDDAYEATIKNLDELQLEYVDLVLIHRPPSDGVGENLWRGLIRAKQDSLTRDIGVSNYSEEQIQNLADVTGEIPAVNQIEWSPFGWSEEMYDYCHVNNIVIQAYSPLTRGKRLSDGILQEIADRYAKTPAQIVLRWCIQADVVPLPKANQLQHLEDNLEVFDFVLSVDDMVVLNGMNEQYSALGDKPAYIS